METRCNSSSVFIRNFKKLQEKQKVLLLLKEPQDFTQWEEEPTLGRELKDLDFSFDSASFFLCDLEEIIFCLWTSVSSHVK